MFSSLYYHFETLCLSFYSQPLYRAAAYEGRGKLSYLGFLAVICTTLVFWKALLFIQLIHDDFIQYGVTELPTLHFTPQGKLSIDRPQPYVLSPTPTTIPDMKITFDDSGETSPASLKNRSVLMTDQSIHIKEQGEISSYRYADLALTGRTVTPADIVDFVDGYLLMIKISTWFTMVIAYFLLLLIATVFAAAMGNVVHIFTSAKVPVRLGFAQFLRMGALAITPAFLIEIPIQHYTAFDFPKIPFYAGYMMFALYALYQPHRSQR